MTGWNEITKAFDGEIQIQNAATALPSRWTIPTHGRVFGSGGRIEPAAAGGIYGKGFWMDGSTGLAFTIPTQAGSESLADKSWYVGLFVDARFDDDDRIRSLLTFPNGAVVKLYGRRQLLLVNSFGDILHRATIPAPLHPPSATGNGMNDLFPEEGWTHLALQNPKRRPRC